MRLFSNRKAENGSEVEFEQCAIIDYNEEYLENCQDKETIRIAKTYNQKDILLIQSMLQSEGIYSFSEFGNMNSLFPGVAIQGYTDSYIYVLTEDKEMAKTIIQEYIDAIKTSGNGIWLHQLRNIIEVLIGGYVMPKNGAKMLPELLNIE